MDFIDVVSACDQDPTPTPIPIDIEKEYAELQYYLTSRRAQIQSKTSNSLVESLIQAADKLDSRIDSLSRINFRVFLQES